MNYIILFIVALAGIALGMYIARRNKTVGFVAKQMEQKVADLTEVWIIPTLL